MRKDEFVPEIDGRALERWFMKTICGAVACDAVKGPTIRYRWIKALFEKIPWPDEWAFFAIGETASVVRNFGMEFRGEANAVVGIESLVISTFGIQSLLSLQAPVPLPVGWLRRPPKGLGLHVDRPVDGAREAGIPATSELTFRLRWS